MRKANSEVIHVTGKVGMIVQGTVHQRVFGVQPRIVFVHVEVQRMVLVKRIAHVQLGNKVLRTVFPIGGMVSLLPSKARNGRQLRTVPIVSVFGRIVHAIPSPHISRVEVEV